LIPLEAILEVGRHFLKKQGSSTGVAQKELVRIAVQSLGMEEVSEFNSQHKIIEYRFKKPGRLASMSSYDFMDELASDSPAPGGGSVAAVNGALSAGLSSMVGNLTFGKKDYKNVRQEMISIAEKAQHLKDFFVEAMDKDTEAFNKIMDSFSLPKKTPEEIELRNNRILEATKEATLVPLSVLEKSKEAADLALLVTEKGNRNSLSDAGVAGLTASVAAEAALFNVMINLEGIDDENFTKMIRTQALQLNKKVQSVVGKIKNLLNKELNIRC